MLTRVMSGAVKRLTPAFYAGFILTMRCGGIALFAAGAASLASLARLSSELQLTAAACVHELRSAAARVRGFSLRQSRAQNVALAAVAASAFLIRAFYLYAQPMRYDEACTWLRYVRQGLLRTLINDYTPNNHLLHTIAVFVVTRFAGSTPVSIRLPAFVAGVFTVIAAWYCFSRFYGASAGLLAAALVATNADLISFSTNARGYSFIAAMFLVQLVLADALAKEPARRGLWALFAVVSIAAICTVPTGIYPVAAAAGVYLFLAVRGGSGLLGAATPLAFALGSAGMVSAFVYWPILLGSGYAALFENRFVQPESMRDFVSRSPGSFGDVWNQWSSGWYPWFAWLVAGAAACGVIATRPRRSVAALPLFAIAAFTCLVMSILQRVTPPARVWLFLLPLYLGTAAAGADFVLRRLTRPGTGWKAGAAAIVILAAGGIQVMTSGAVLNNAETGTNNDASHVAAFLSGKLRPDDLLISTLPASYPVRFYLVRDGISEDLWAAQNRKIARILAIVDKPDPVLSPAQRHSGLVQAFEESYTGISQSDFDPGQTIYDSNKTQVVAMTRRAPQIRVGP